jgi:hypothetical protein
VYVYLFSLKILEFFSLETLKSYLFIFKYLSIDILRTHIVIIVSNDIKYSNQ